MPDSFVQVAADGPGKRLRTNTKIINALEVHEQYVLQAGLPTYYCQGAQAAAAAGKIFLDVFNAAGSGIDILIKKVFLQPVYAAVTGASSVWEVRRTSAVGTGGTALTPLKADTLDANLPAQITVRSLPTGGATSAGAFLTLPISSEETSLQNMAWPFSIVSEGNETKDIHCHPGEGISVVQTVGTVGTFSVLAVIAVG